MTKAYYLAGYPAGASASCASTLHAKPKIKARIEELRITLAENAQGLAARQLAKEVAKDKRMHIRNVEHRVAKQQDMWDRMQALIDARAADALVNGSAPGGETGLLARSLKAVGSGPNAMIVPQYEVDTGLIAEWRQLQELTARELGQRAENQNATTVNIALLMPNGTPAAADGVQHMPTAAAVTDGSVSASEAILDITTTR